MNISADFCSQRESRVSFSCFLQLHVCFPSWKSTFPVPKGRMNAPLTKEQTSWDELTHDLSTSATKPREQSFISRLAGPATTDWNRTKDTGRRVTLCNEEMDKQEMHGCRRSRYVSEKSKRAQSTLRGTCKFIHEQRILLMSLFVSRARPICRLADNIGWY